MNEQEIIRGMVGVRIEPIFACSEDRTWYVVEGHDAPAFSVLLAAGREFRVSEGSRLPKGTRVVRGWRVLKSEADGEFCDPDWDVSYFSEDRPTVGELVVEVAEPVTYVEVPSW